jgi:hypothetical protein
MRKANNYCVYGNHLAEKTVLEVQRKNMTVWHHCQLLIYISSLLSSLSDNLQQFEPNLKPCHQL